MDGSRLREGLIAAINGRARGRAVADQLCAACVELLDVDGAALSVVHEGVLSRAFGSSGKVSTELIELQFALGEGPSVEVADLAVATTANLDGPEAHRWPTFAGEASQLGVRMLFILPVAVAGFPTGTLCLHRNRLEPFDGATVEGCFLAAELASMPLLDLLAIDLNASIDDDSSTAWDDMALLTRAEVYQAAGVLMAQLEVSPAEALVRLRGYAYTHGKTASQVAYAVLSDDLRLDDDRW